jgi:uncharacterized protein (DUF2461 family)
MRTWGGAFTAGLSRRNQILGDVMKRVPRGHPVDHPRAGLLKHRSLTAGRELDPDAVRDVEPVYRACERLRPLLGWLEQAVAAPQAKTG